MQDSGNPSTFYATSSTTKALFRFSMDTSELRTGRLIIALLQVADHVPIRCLLLVEARSRETGAINLSIRQHTHTNNSPLANKQQKPTPCWPALTAQQPEVRSRMAKVAPPDSTSLAACVSCRHLVVVLLRAICC